ncbi:MAG: hypothetical protein ACR2OZ_18755 [Verrucomicrobiales bacterium]
MRSAFVFLLGLLLCGRGDGRPEDERFEVQLHGYAFEKWVRNTFFGGYQPRRYTQQWDIPAQANTTHGGIPANPKAVKYGTSIDLGDALRQFETAGAAKHFCSSWASGSR